MIHELPLHNVARLEAAVKIQHQQCHELDTMTDINHTGSHLCQNTVYSLRMCLEKFIMTNLMNDERFVFD